MAGETAIEWADATWNPIVGCEIVSPGCKHCYAMGQAARIEAMAAGAGRPTHYAGTTVLTKTGPVFTGKVREASAATLSVPMRWRRPRRIFVNSMGDLFAPGVTDTMRDRVWAVMACAPWHTFIVLTKRAGAMRAYLTALTRERLLAWVETEVDHPTGRRKLIDAVDVEALTQPLRNVWVGVTAEDQVRADERIPELLVTPAAVRVVSVEPMIGPVALKRVQVPIGGVLNALRGAWASWPLGSAAGRPIIFKPENGTRLDWVIVGGESGRGRGVRPLHPAWARQVRDDCAAAGVPFFFKQWGEWSPVHVAEGDELGALTSMDVLGRRDEAIPAPAPGDDDDPYWTSWFFERIGKRAAGGLLDGVAHHAWPERCA